MTPRDAFIAGYYREEARFFNHPPGKASDWRHEVGQGLWRVSQGGILILREVWKKASRHKNAQLVSVGWESADITPAGAEKTYPVSDELWSYLTPLKTEYPVVRYCDRCDARLDNGGYDMYIPKTGLVIQPPEIVSYVLGSFGGVIVESGFKKKYHICGNCIPEGWDYCKRCHTAHPLVLRQQAIAHLVPWIEATRARPLPSGRFLINGADWMHPGDSVEWILGHISDALVCFPRSVEARESLNVNIKKLETLKEWSEGLVR